MRCPILLFVSLVWISQPALAQPSSPAVLPLEEITADAAPSVGEFKGSEAVLRFVSSIPLACSVIFGETTGYGQIAVDSDMGGGAHSDHHPILSGLKPDTVYHFRVQGTSADGRIFASRDMTFRTPSAVNSPINLLSLDAGAKIISVSSNYGNAPNDASWGANGAIDGKRSTEWATNGDGDGAFIEIELARKSKLDSIEVWTRTMSDGTAQIASFTIETDTGKTFGPFKLADASKPYRFQVSAVASRLRLSVTRSSGGNTGLVEFAAFGAPL